VGRRLAFDAARGRLWVVCRRCERWNLTPLEERWEAVEECERRFRQTRLRVSTRNIGLARLREGLELVRVGEPLRPEFAAWRYGDQFGRRRRATMLKVGLGLGAIGAVVAGGVAAGVGVGGAGAAWQAASSAAPPESAARARSSRRRVIAAFCGTDGPAGKVASAWLAGGGRSRSHQPRSPLRGALTLAHSQREREPAS
jgi:hypothetical protein